MKKPPDKRIIKNLLEYLPAQDLWKALKDTWRSKDTKEKDKPKTKERRIKRR